MSQAPPYFLPVTAGLLSLLLCFGIGTAILTSKHVSARWRFAAFFMVLIPLIIFLTITFNH